MEELNVITGLREELNDNQKNKYQTLQHYFADLYFISLGESSPVNHHPQKKQWYIIADCHQRYN